ncbi:transcription initiation factor TFIID subunit 7-like [Pectinophora gossypiella]|uniref:TAFII55 protein conserved region domain-containing protein n=1 Tax=Pectinophora gossypiella TaxID=13191 RepID=A0A1E1WT79_PECGO|nr:transcription initiation factor TFIID subunit 7-like [Pectinophora gossypiella]
MNKREPDYPVELESQIIMRLPEEPAKLLKEVLKTGENFKNRLTIQIDNDMRKGEVRFDHWLLHGKIVDLPTIVESLKTIDRKSVYKTADICQMMICKDELDPTTTEEESPTKNKKKDPLKVDKKFLWPHGITPPTKNVRKRRFRKTLKKKSAEAPEIEKEVKRLLRADYEAVNVTWEIIKEEDEHNLKPEPSTSGKPEKTKMKKEANLKLESNQSSSKVEDIFGGALSDSDLEDENINVDVEDSHLSSYGDHFSDSSAQGTGNFKGGRFATQFSTEMFTSAIDLNDESLPSSSTSRPRASAGLYKSDHYPTDEFLNPQATDNSNTSFKLQQLSAELEELKQRRQRTQLEISGMENMTLRQRFQDILQTLNKDIKYKEIEYQNLQSLMK